MLERLGHGWTGQPVAALTALAASDDESTVAQLGQMGGGEGGRCSGASRQLACGELLSTHEGEEHGRAAGVPEKGAQVGEIGVGEHGLSVARGYLNLG